MVLCSFSVASTRRLCYHTTWISNCGLLACFNVGTWLDFFFFFHSCVGLLLWRHSVPSSWPICFVWLWLCECWFICANNVPPECRDGEPLIVTMFTIDSELLSPPCLFCQCSFLLRLCHVLFKHKSWVIDNQCPLLLLQRTNRQ